MRNYGQYCPIARSSEILAERWTPIIVRNLLRGCHTFNEIRQGAPGIPTALLSQRLHSLEAHGIVRRRPAPSGHGGWYELTEMGQELRAVCDALGQWGAKWLEIEPRHLEPAYILWATTKLVDVQRIPDHTTVVRFDLTDRPAAHYWLILRQPQPELCTNNVGYVEDIVCRTEGACLVDLHLKRITYSDAIRTGRLTLDGSATLIRQFPTWFRTSPFADFVTAGDVQRAAAAARSGDDPAC